MPGSGSHRSAGAPGGGVTLDRWVSVSMPVAPVIAGGGPPSTSWVHQRQPRAISGRPTVDLPWVARSAASTAPMVARRPVPAGADGDESRPGLRTVQPDSYSVIAPSMHRQRGHRLGRVDWAVAAQGDQRHPARRRWIRSRPAWTLSAVGFSLTRRKRRPRPLRLPGQLDLADQSVCSVLCRSPAAPCTAERLDALGDLARAPLAENQVGGGEDMCVRRRSWVSYSSSSPPPF